MRRLGLWLFLVCAAATPNLVAAEPPSAPAPQEADAVIVPRYLLQSPDGRVVTDSDFPGRFQLITFGYTWCPDICPTTLAAMTQVLGLLGEQAAQVQPIFITVDPERDTLTVLHRYAEYFDARILPLTGSPELVRAAADHFRVTYKKYLEPGKAADQYSVDHTAGMFLVGPDDQFVTHFGYSVAPATIAARLKSLIAEQPANKPAP